jgi:hypothetical protein
MSNMCVLQRQDGLVFAGLDRNAWAYTPAWTNLAEGGKIEVQHKDRWPSLLEYLKAGFGIDPEDLEGKLVKLALLPYYSPIYFMNMASE